MKQKTLTLQLLAGLSILILSSCEPEKKYKANEERSRDSYWQGDKVKILTNNFPGITNGFARWTELRDRNLGIDSVYVRVNSINDLGNQEIYYIVPSALLRIPDEEYFELVESTNKLISERIKTRITSNQTK